MQKKRSIRHRIRPAVVSWKKKAPTVRQKADRALQTHHRAKRIGPKCGVITCNKMCVENSDYCVHHRNLRVGNIPVKNNDLNAYGE